MTETTTESTTEATIEPQYVWLQNISGHDVKTPLLGSSAVKAGAVVKLRAEQVLPEGHTFAEGEHQVDGVAVWPPNVWAQVEAPPAGTPDEAELEQPEQPAVDEQPADEHDTTAPPAEQ